MAATTLYLFRNDLRLNDNSALSAACNSDQPVLLLYILDDYSKQNWPMGSASRWWLHHSLESLSKDIQKLGGKLYLRRGNTISILDEILNTGNINKLYFSRTYVPYQCEVEEKIYSRWHEQIEIKRYGGYLLFEPEQIQTGSKQPYKVFTPFWKACLKEHEPQLAKSKLTKTIRFSPIKFKHDVLDDWGLLPAKPDWAIGFKNSWKPGEAGAKKALQEFIATGLEHYEEDRNRPDRQGTSRLSPHLHFAPFS